MIEVGIRNIPSLQCYKVLILRWMSSRHQLHLEIWMQSTIESRSNQYLCSFATASPIWDADSHRSASGSGRAASNKSSALTSLNIQYYPISFNLSSSCTANHQSIQESKLSWKELILMRVSRGYNPCLTQCEVHIKPTHTWQWDRVNGGEWWLNICCEISHMIQSKSNISWGNSWLLTRTVAVATVVLVTAQEALDMTQRSPSGNWPASPPTSKCFSSMTRSQDRLNALGPWDKMGCQSNS